MIQRPAQIVIQSDASLAGWGAVCNGVNTGGTWSPKDQMMHINCLELLAADLAVRTFLKDRQGVSVLLHATGKLHGSGLHKQHWRDSVAISHFASEDPVALGPAEGHSPYIPTHSRYIQSGSGSRIQIGAGQVGLDANSCSVPEDQSNIWPTGSGPICRSLDSPTATFFSWRPDPLAEAVDAFQQNWSLLKGYVNPPWCLVGRVLK